MTWDEERCRICGQEGTHLSWCNAEKKKHRINLDEAQKVARKIMTLIEPDVTKIQLVGSIGRQEALVSDIDILCAPRYDSLGREKVSFTYHIEKIRHKLKKIGTWNRGADRQMTVDNVYDSGLKLDLFLQHPPAQWGVLVGVRLNPKELVIWAKNKMDEDGLIRKNGAIFTKGGAEIPVATEEDWFALIGLDYVDPIYRNYLALSLGLGLNDDRRRQDLALDSIQEKETSASEQA